MMDALEDNRTRAITQISETYGPVSMDALDQDRLLALSRSGLNVNEAEWLVSPTANKAGKKMIFDNPYVTGLVIQWKKNRDARTYEMIVKESSDLMDSIIRKRKFHLSAPFQDIKGSMYLQFSNWLEKFDPSLSTTLYTYISSACKHAAIAYVRREQALRDRVKYTDVPMEAFNESYTQSFDHETMQSIHDAVEEVLVRWNEPHIRDIIRFIIKCIVSGRGENRNGILRSINIGFDVEQSTAKFLVDWSFAAVRQAVFEKHDQPLGQLDVIRASEKFSFIPDVAATIGIEATIKLMNIFAGCSIKFPTQQQIRRTKVVAKSLKRLDEDFNSADEISDEAGCSAKQVLETYEFISDNISAGLLEDNPLEPNY